ncbi:MAG TPA: hypothetical protein G4N98_03115 [Thermoflexia bacterium]|nr:hypothetical protein [Thermoflexia bacterium]
MLKFMPKQDPASMLAHHQKLPRSTHVKLSKIRAACQQADWATVHALEQQAYEQWSTTGDWWSYGVILVSLGDGVLKCQHPARAEYFYQEAQRIFHLRVDPTQRRNEAAATYGLALTAMLSGRRIRAIELLDRSMALLKESEEHWVMMHANYEQADRCADKRLWIEGLATQVMTQSQPEVEIPYGPFQRSSERNPAARFERRVFWGTAVVN